jgi:Tol biopolymer transport system component
VARNLSAEGDFQDYFVSWAFDGQRVNFLSNRAGGLSAAQVNPDGTNLRGLSVVEAIGATILDGRLDWDPSWSPSDEAGGIRTLWASLRDFNLEIYVGDASAQNGVRLTNDAARDWFMSWSPDGSRIAFSSDRAGNEDIYLMNADGSDLTQLTTHEATDLYPVWSLDGEHILFVTERDGLLEDGILTLYIMNPDGSDQRPLGVAEVFEGDPTYSADGQAMAYMSNEAGDWNIYVMNADGSGVRRVTEGDADEMFPVWRPVPAEAG